jgi:regulator of sirC expression with transglutaminase-like and TPR domain
VVSWSAKRRNRTDTSTSKGREDASRALELKPGDAHALLYRGIAHLDLRDVELGLADLKAARTSTDDPAAVELIEGILAELESR